MSDLKLETGVLDLTGHIGGLAVTKNQLAQNAVMNLKMEPVNYNPWGISGQMVMTPEGPISVDDFIKRERELKEWLRIKEIIEKHSIIEELPDGDVVIRIKRKRQEQVESEGKQVDPSEFRVDFGVDEDEEEE